MRDAFLSHLRGTLDQIRADGFYKTERVIASPQAADIKLEGGAAVLNFCANNYLGLADDPRLVAAAKDGLERDGFGMASVRFICGTQTVHKELERALSAFLQTDDCILYSSCFDANGGLFETLLDDNDAIISDELNHASIIDGVRLAKAKRYRYKNNDLADLEVKLQEADAAGARFKLIATDGVFSMDGIIANLAGICDLADRYGALVMVDDSHAVGFIGEHGRGTPEHCGVLSRVDIITGTLGKALGGASGGYVAARLLFADKRNAHLELDHLPCAGCVIKRRAELRIAFNRSMTSRCERCAGPGMRIFGSGVGNEVEVHAIFAAFVPSAAIAAHACYFVVGQHVDLAADELLRFGAVAVVEQMSDVDRNMRIVALRERIAMKADSACRRQFGERVVARKPHAVIADTRFFVRACGLDVARHQWTGDGRNKNVAVLAGAAA